MIICIDWVVLYVCGRARLVFGQLFTIGQRWYRLTLHLEPRHLAPTLISNLFRFGITVIDLFRRGDLPGRPTKNPLWFYALCSSDFNRLHNLPLPPKHCAAYAVLCIFYIMVSVIRLLCKK